MNHTQGDILTDPDGVVAISKKGNTFYMVRSGRNDCRGCCFGPHSKCRNGYDLCVKHHGKEYRDWIYRESTNGN